MQIIQEFCVELAGSSNFTITADDLTRVHNKLKDLGFEHLDRQRQINFLKTGSNYCQHLLLSDQVAGEWVTTFNLLAEQISKQDSSPPKQRMDPILTILLDQPSTRLPIDQQKKCFGIAGRVVIGLCLNFQASASFTHGMKQLMHSARPEWLEIRNHDLLNRAKVLEFRDSTDKAAVKDFLNVLAELLRASVPPIGHYIAPANAQARARASTNDVQDDDHPEGRHENIEEQDDCSPNLKLFEKQISLCQHPDRVDGYRLDIQWSRLHPDELKQSVNRLTRALRDLRPESSHESVHAAARFVSLFSGLSLKTCLRLPLVSKGKKSKHSSMHLHLGQGVLRRNVLCVADRSRSGDRLRFNGQWWRFHVPPEVVRVLARMHEAHPHCLTLGDLLHAVGLNHEKCQRLLNKDWPTSHRPEDSRFANSLRPCLLHLGVHPTLVARITGDIMTTPPADHYYLSIFEDEVDVAVELFCRWAELDPPAKPTKNRLIGSPKYISLEDFRKLMQELNKLVVHARNKITTRSEIQDLVEFHNLYTKSVALQLIWGLGARGTRIGRLSFERIFAEPDLIAISDRRVDKYSRQRICPSTGQLTASRAHYLEHLRSFADRIKDRAPRESAQLDAEKNGKRPHRCAFQIFDNSPEGWKSRGLNRSDLTALLTTLSEGAGLRLTREDLNASRHFWHSELVRRNVAQVAIEALLGHHIPNAEAFGFASGISVRDVADYLRPILNTIHQEVGLAPLVGLGRTAARYLNFPSQPVPQNLRELPSSFLKHKLAAQDLVIQEVTVREQDPPTNSKTLLSHRYLSDLHSRYVRSELVREYPLGSTLFCLVAFELVLNEPEQQALLAAGFGQGLWHVDQLCILEAEHNGRPIVQRLPCDHTIAAFSVARAKGTRQKTARALYIRACLELHNLLLKLSPVWACKKKRESVRLLAKIASHWAAIEIPPGSLYCALHKAPFIPASDVARLHHGKPVAMKSDSAAKAMTREQRNSPGSFDRIKEIVLHWSNRDHPLGESAARAAGCTADLNALIETGSVRFVDGMLIRLLLADLSPQAPYRSLDINTLSSYTRRYIKFFEPIQHEDSLDLEPEYFSDAHRAMGGSSDMHVSGPARWAMLHICSFLSQQGYWVPQGLTQTPATKIPRPPRLPVYTSSTEIDKCCSDLKSAVAGLGGTYESAAAQLMLLRNVPLRAAEIRYCRPTDYDSKARLLHITTSGHNHLKNVFSRGSVRVPDAIASEIHSYSGRRLALSVGSSTLLFADAHLSRPYKAYDRVSLMIKETVVKCTGRTEFRKHDFRSSAATDFCFPVTAEITHRAQGHIVSRASKILTGDELEAKFVRFATASNAARHHGNLTVLRYYNCSGAIDLAHELSSALSPLEPWGRYLACISGRSAQAQYAAANRSKAAVRTSLTANMHERLLRGTVAKFVGSLPTPILQGSKVERDEWNIRTGPAANVPLGRPQSSAIKAASPLPTADLSCISAQNSFTKSAPEFSESGCKLIHAALLVTCGMSTQAAADALLFRQSVLDDAMERLVQLQAAARFTPPTRDCRPLLIDSFRKNHAEKNLHARLQHLSEWLHAKQNELKRHAVHIIPAVRDSTAALRVHSPASLSLLLPVLKGLNQIGLRIIVRPGSNVMLATHGFSFDDDSSGIEAHPLNSKDSVFCCIYFAFMPNSACPPAKLSPRAIGMAGRLVLSGMLFTLAN